MMNAETAYGFLGCVLLCSFHALTRLEVVMLKGTTFHFVLAWFSCGYMWKINDDSGVPLANFCFALNHIFQLTLVYLLETPKHCRGETLSLERLTGEWNIKQNMFS